MSREQVAIIGGGVAGLTAAHLLRRRYDVLVFEALPKLGGHADTRRVRTPDRSTVAVDTGFIVHNRRTYPQLVRLFQDLSVATCSTDMSMSVRCHECGLQYSGGKRGWGLVAVAPSRIRSRYLRMLTEIPRFHRDARAMLAGPADDDVTLSQLVAAGDYSCYFVQHYLSPMVSTVWSVGASTGMVVPARYILEFLRNHGLLDAGHSLRWRYVVGGACQYVDRIAAGLANITVEQPIRAVRRHANGVEIVAATGRSYDVDRAVIATHADQALALLTDATERENRVLGAFTYSRSRMVLHTDSALLPSRRRIRASWNHTRSACHGEDRVAVSYHMNRLLRLSEPLDYVVSLNQSAAIDQSAIIATADYEHPIHTRESVSAQRGLADLGGKRIAFAGSYHGWGFHEDACLSGVRAARSFGVTW